LGAVIVAVLDATSSAMEKRLDEVKWDMLNEWAETKQAPSHGRWMHQ
jgi:lactoylglutathione lyase